MKPLLLRELLSPTRRGLAWVLASFFYLTPGLQCHAEDGLLVLYTFEEGSGTVVRDVSGVGTPLDLTIGDQAAVRWLPEGGLAVNTAVLIASSGAATKVIEACQESGSMTIEAWVKPANISQSGPARMVGVAADTGNRNFTLGQHQGSWAIRVRTTEASVNGIPQMPAVPSPDSNPLDPIMFTEPRLMHVVFTHDWWTGHEVLYLDGVPVIERFLGGDFSGWNSGYRLGLAAELNSTAGNIVRPWLGEMYRVAIYDRPWSAEEVAQKFDELTPKLEVTDLVPELGTIFHPAQEGISFRVITLADNTVAQNDVQLSLNGQDRSDQLQFTGTPSDWRVTVSGLEPNQSYEGELNVADNQGRTRRISLQFQTHALRDDGLLVLYTFEEGNGAVVRDVSEAGPPLNLNIDNTGAVRWIEGGGLAIESPVRIASSSADLSTKIRQPVQQSGALTVEAWIRSSNSALQAARVFTMSEFRQGFPGTEEDNSLRNMSLLQHGNSYRAYLRTSVTGETGRPPLDTPEMDVSVPVQVVYTRDASGQARLYIDGVEVAEQLVEGEFSNWISGFRLGLGYELSEVTQAPADHRFRHWLGEFYRVAVYNRALSAADVLQNFNEFTGTDGVPLQVPQNVAVTAGAVFAVVTWETDPQAGGRIGYEIERNGEIIASFATGNSYLDRSAAPGATYSYRVRAVDFAKNSSDFSPSVQATTKSLVELTGLVRAEFYSDIGPGVLVSDLEAAEKFPDNPDVTLFLPSLETPINWGNNYGVRVTGWFIPPQTGEYVFFIASDDQGYFRLSTDATPANLKLIAEEPVWNPFRTWTGTTRRDAFPDAPDNRSDLYWYSEWPGDWSPDMVIQLQGGQRYYFEALMKEGGGDDHLGVTFKMRGEADPVNGTASRMTGPVIQTMADPDFVMPIITTQPQSQGAGFGQSVTLNVEVAGLSSPPLAYQWRFEGNNIPGATSPSYTIPSFQNEHAGDYSVVVSNFAGATTSAVASLAAGGLIALYTFEEGSGAVVRDVSNFGEPLDLTIASPGAVRWLPDGGLVLDADVLIASPGPATKVTQAIRASHELTVEVWATPANITQAGPARFVTLSANTGNRNFTLGQDAGNFQFRFRTTATDANGGPNYITAVGAVSTSLTHVVYTRDRDNQSKLYINGVQAVEMPLGGVPSNWDLSYRLGLGGELSNERFWHGELHRVAIHSTALAASEIAAAFEAGPRAGGPSPVEPVILTGISHLGATFQFGFASLSGRQYVVEFKDNLDPGPWIQLSLIEGDGTVKQVSDGSLDGANSRFYRVRIE